jgi:glutamate 5-kinase
MSNAGVETSSDPRDLIRRARRIVVKIGSKALASDQQVYDRLARDIAAAQAERRAVAVVSSGAIALGIKKLGLAARPKEMALLQASAAAGQSVLMRLYEEAFAARSLSVAQVLLTHADLADRARANNARDALAALLDAGLVPIINENDTVAVEEIRFGENDLLASMVVPLVGADLLILLSDVPGLLDGQGQRVPTVRNILLEAKPLAGGSTSGVGTGGMTSKVEAARRATLAGATVVVSDARAPHPIAAILEGSDVGTVFVPHLQRIQARKHWIAFTLRPKGAVLLDPGAVEAVVESGVACCRWECSAFAATSGRVMRSRCSRTMGVKSGGDSLAWGHRRSLPWPEKRAKSSRSAGTKATWSSCIGTTWSSRKTEERVQRVEGRTEWCRLRRTERGSPQGVNPQWLLRRAPASEPTAGVSS